MSYAAFSVRARRRIQRDLAQAVASKLLNVNTVRFHYQVKTGGVTNRYSERNDSAEYADKWVEFSAFVHFVQPVESGLRRYMEVEVGDVLVDLVEGTTGTDDEANTGVTLVFDGPTIFRPRFEIDGRFFTQKALGAELAQFWDVKMGDVRVIRTFLLGYQAGDNV